MHRRVADWLPGLRPNENKIITSLGRQRLQYLYSARGQRHAMLATGLHPFRWHRPNLVFKIDFPPPSLCNFIRSGSYQNCNLQRLRCDTLTLSQFGHERGDSAIIESRLMLSFRDLRVRGQELAEVAAPARWIVAGAEARGRRPIENSFNALPQPVAGFR